MVKSIIYINICRNDRMTRTFTFESPNITLKYLPEGKRYGDVYSIAITLIERQKGLKQSTINTIQIN